ncbi:MAG: GntG family PLP-dependent aldolase [Bacteroidota bacterium]
MGLIDLRSDTVTRPDAGMIAAMANAEVGDDVYGEDPTVNRLEERVAEMLGKEKALFVPTGVMSNQLCLKVLTSPGDEVILGESSHIFNYETGAPALLSGIQLHTVRNADGSMRLPDIESAVRENVYYMPKTSVIALEQTHNREGGTIVPIEDINAISRFGRTRGIALHLDGARIWNASVASGISPKDYASRFDTVSVCLSKGLGAPVGSLMAGSAQQIEMARHFRKIWGGGWRQAGILAAAGLYALDNNINRLAEDHKKAEEFAHHLEAAPKVHLLRHPQTNIVIFSAIGIAAEALTAAAEKRGLLISSAFKGKIRAVFHKDVSMDDAIIAAETIVKIAEAA